MTSKILSPRDYTVAWVCALPLELAATKTVLDEIHASLPQPESDENVYTLGAIGGHNVVVVCLAFGAYGTVSTAVSRVLTIYPNIQFGFMVGIGGGVPSKSTDIRLGDVVVSKPTTTPGAINYDHATAVYDRRLKYTGSLTKYPLVLWERVPHIRVDMVRHIMDEALRQDGEQIEKFSRPKNDWLFQATYNHQPNKPDCTACDRSQLVERFQRTSDGPCIHFGLIASGDQIMKDAIIRDSIARDLDILCFDNIGFSNALPSLVIRGICDYCDSHRNKDWQGYAALAAAAYAKVLLSLIPLPKRQSWVVPFERNPNFVGRQNEIDRLKRLILMPSGPRKLALAGLGGVGKTQTVLELAYQLRDENPEYSVFWIPCTSHETVEEAYSSITQKLGMQDLKSGYIREDVNTYLSQKRSGKWLLIFDDVDDHTWIQSSDTSPALMDFLPQSEQGRIICTTRNRELASQLAFEVISMCQLDEESGMRLLERSLIQKDLLDDKDKALELLQQLTFLPLAITQTAAFINRNGMGLSDCLVLLQEQESAAREPLSVSPGDAERHEETWNSFTSAWLVSFDQIRGQDQLAGEYLLLMALVGPQNIPESLLPQPTVQKKTDALGLLSASSLIKVGKGGFFSLHRLVRQEARNWMTNNGLFTFYISKMAAKLSEVFPDNDHTNRKRWREYLPHALSLIGESEFKDQQEHYVDFIEKVGRCLNSDGRYNEAEMLFANALSIRRRKFGDENPSTLVSMANLASTYQNQGRWNEAKDLQIRVLETRKQALGPESPSTLSSMGNLASIYMHQEQLDEAAKLLMHVLEAQKKVLGSKHPDTLSSMHNLAFTYMRQERLDDAAKLLVHVLKTRKLVLGLEHPYTLSSMDHLASTYMRQGRLHEAERLLIQVMESSKQVLGPEHPDTLSSMGNLVSTYMRQERLDEAETLLTHVMETSKRVLGPHHPLTQAFMSMAASVAKSKDLLTQQAESSCAGTTLVGTQDEYVLELKPSSSLDPTASDAFEDEDCISVVSNDTDIASQVGRNRAEPEIFAVRQFGTFLGELEELRSLHEEALKKLGAKRFQENYRRILKLYVLKLRDEARTAIEKDTILVLKSRLNRVTIAQRILGLIQEDKENSAKPLDELTLQPVEKQSLEDWARNAYGSPVEDTMIDSGLEGYEPSSDGSDSEDHEEVEFPNITQANRFLLRGIPFQTLVLELRLLVLPASLREVMESIPKRSIHISCVNDTSFMNQAKAFIEDYTACEWDWWPLAPRVPELPPGKLHLQWKFCGETLYREIAPEEAVSIQQILESIGDHPPKCFCCETKTHRPNWTSLFHWAWQSLKNTLYWEAQGYSLNGQTSPSIAHQRYTPRTTSTANASSISTGTSPPDPPANNTSLIQAHGGNPSIVSPTQHCDPLWVIFGIKDRHGFDEIENIKVPKQFNDPSFFKELKQRYAKRRWFFQRWLSPFRFRYCRFVQFETINFDQVYCPGEALPDDHGYASHYEYSPRPPRAINPLINRTLFSICLKACDVGCPWAYLPSSLHKCRSLPQNSHTWKRIPSKKGGAFETSSSQPGEIAFGIEADHALSFAILFAYHAVLIFSAFIFWIYWLNKHPGDLQNASVPSFTVLALIGTFWGLVGRHIGAP